MAITSIILILMGCVMLWNGHEQNKVNRKADEAKARECEKERKRLNRHVAMYRKR